MKSSPLLQKSQQEEAKQLKPLSKAQNDLLEVLKDPKHALLPVDELIKLAEISRATYYNAFKDNNFVMTLESEMAELRSRNDFAVMHNLVEQAKTSSNHNLLALYQRLQGRLKEGGEKPAQIILVFGEGIQRPQMKVADAEVIVEAEKE
jgi:hypothetical protein